MQQPRANFDPFETESERDPAVAHFNRSDTESCPIRAPSMLARKAKIIASVEEANNTVPIAFLRSR